MDFPKSVPVLARGAFSYIQDLFVFLSNELHVVRLKTES